MKLLLVEASGTRTVDTKRYWDCTRRTSGGETGQYLVRLLVVDGLYYHDYGWYVDYWY